MAYHGPWGCYIHIPKTSGTWVKRVLSSKGSGFHGQSEGSLTHDMPVNWDMETWAVPYAFTVVREPAEWLASVWAHRVRERWDVYPREIYWRKFCEAVDPFRENKFPMWIDKITKNRPGVVGWLYGCYAPPWVHVIRKEDQLYPWFRDHGYDPDSIKPLNVGGNRAKSVVTPQIREKVYLAEEETYQRYGYY